MQPQMDQVINTAMAIEFPLNIIAIKTILQSSNIIEHPRFLSFLVRNSDGREYWRRMQIDIDRHVIVHHQPLSDAPWISDEDVVNDFITDLAVSSPLPYDNPLWETHLLIAYKSILFRVHHLLGSGISLMPLLLSFCRRIDDPTKILTIGAVKTAPSVRKRWSVWTLVMVVWYSLVYTLEFVLRVFCLREENTAESGGAEFRSSEKEA